MPTLKLLELAKSSVFAFWFDFPEWNIRRVSIGVLKVVPFSCVIPAPWVVAPEPMVFAARGGY